MKFIFSVAFLSLFSVFSVSGGLYDCANLIDEVRKLELTDSKRRGEIKFSATFNYDLLTPINNIHDSADVQYILIGFFTPDSTPFFNTVWEAYKDGVMKKFQQKHDVVNSVYSSIDGLKLIRHPQGEFYPVKFLSIPLSDSVSQEYLEYMKNSLKEEFNVMFAVENVSVECESLEVTGVNLDVVEKIAKNKLPVAVSQKSESVCPIDERKRLSEDMFKSADEKVEISNKPPVYTLNLLLSLAFKNWEI